MPVLNRPFPLFFLLLLPLGKIFALPSGMEVVHGKAECIQVGENNVSIAASDKAILNFQSFNIDHIERVTFQQPGKDACVLGRIIGPDPSQILGRLDANGRVFLVNPNGVYFGPNAVVNVPSLVVSTLDIRNDDFISGEYQFSLDDGKNGAIVNEGSIFAEGAIALIAPVIQNRGSIFSATRSIVLAAGKKVTLDFIGDGLLQFAIDGELEKALIENEGAIRASHGIVDLSMKAAKKAVQSVVNMEGVEIANAMEMQNGVVRLSYSSSVVAKGVHVDADGDLEVSGTVAGEKVKLLADQIALKGAQIDASKVNGGGEVFIGGDYQGKGNLRTSEYTSVDENSTIYADAIGEGNGGKVIVWSDKTTLFDGKVYARGGELGGNGGFVETSGKENLEVGAGHVDTSAPLGKFGDWLLDPAAITIASGGTNGTIASASAPNCGTAGTINIRTATLQAAATNVALCAQNGANSTITVNNAFTMATGVSITMTAGSGSAGTITLNAGITTRGQPISLVGLVSLGAAVALDTTNAGAVPAGGAISFSNTVNGANTLTLNAGTGGAITFSGAVGNTTPPSSVTITNSAALSFNNTVNITGALTQTNAATGTTTFSNTVSAASATLRGVAYSVNNSFTTTGAISVTNSGIFTKGATGTITAPSGFTTTGAVNLANNISTTNTLLQIGGALTIAEAASPTLTAGSGGITISGTVDGTAGGVAETLTLNAAGGAISLAAVGSGSATSLTTLNITNSAAITFGGALNITGALTQTNAATGTTAFNNTVSVGSATLRGTAYSVTNSFAATGAVSVTNSGTFTKGATGAITAAGGFSTTGAVNLANNISTTNTLLQIGGALTIAEAASPVLTAGSGGITISAAVDGTAGGAAETLTLSAAGGAISLAAVGSGSATSLTTLNITNSAGITFGGALNITGALTQTNAATGTTTFSSTVSAASATLRGVAYSINNSFTTTGAVSVTNSGTFTKGATGAITAAGGFSTTGAVNLANNISTTNALLQIGGALTIAEAVTPVLTAGSGGITISGTVDGTAGGVAETLTLSAAGGAINLAAIGSGSATSLTTLTITNSAAITFGGVINIMGALTQTNAATGATTFSNTVSAASATLRGAAYSVNNSFTTTGAISVTNSGTFTKGATGTITAPSGFTTTGDVNVANNISTTNTLLQIGGALTVAEAASPILTAGSGGITISGTVDGTAGGVAETLTLSAAGGAINLAAIGSGSATSLTTLNITNSAAITFGGALNITGALTQTNAATGTTTFSSTASLGSATLRGTTFSINNSFAATGAVSVTNSGTFTKGATGAITAAGGFSTTGAVNLANSISTTNALLQIGGALTIAEGASPTLTAGSGGITISGTIDGTAGGAAETMTLDAAGGAISLAAVGSGSATSLTTVNITNSAAITFGGALNIAGALTQTNAATGTTTFSSTVSTASAILRGVAYSVNNSFTTTGAISVTNSGTFTKGATGAITAPGGFTTTGAVNLANNISTTNTLLQIGGALTVAEGASPTLNAGSGGITISGAIDGTVGGVAESLTLSAAGGAISLGTVGSGSATGLTALTVTNSAAITFGGVINITGALTQTNAATGTTTFSNTVSLGSATLRGTAYSINNSFAAAGAVSVTNSGTFTKGATGAITAAGGFSTTGDVATSANITTTNTALTIGGNLTLNATTILSTQGAVGAGDILISGTTNGAVNLTLNAGTGSVTLNGAVGGVTPLTSLTVSAGTIYQNGGVTTSGSISYNGATAIHLSSNITTAGFGINMTGPVILDGPVTLDSTNGGAVATGASITFSSTVDGGQNLSCRAGTTGNISFLGALGATTRLGALTLVNSNNVITSSTIRAASITQTNGQSLSSFQSLDVNGGNIFLTGSAISISGDILCTGNVILVNSGALTLADGASTSITGTFSQSGGGGVLLSGTILTVNSAISFADAISLNGTTAISSGAGTGNLSFTSTINGNQNLTLTAGTGTISFGADLGQSTALQSFSVVSSSGITYPNVSASSISQAACSGTTTISGSLSTTGSSGISIAGGVINQTGSLTATGTGSITIQNSSTYTIGASINAANGFTQSGAGAVSLNGSITSQNSNITMNSQTTLMGNSSLDTGAGGGNIHFISAILDGGAGYNLSAAAGTGAIQFDGDLGTSINRLGTVTIVSGVGNTTAAIYASAIAESSGSSTFGVLNTNGASGISLMGSSFTLSSNITTTNSGPLTIQNSAASTLSGATFTISGAFNQSGVGSVTLSSAITSSGGNTIHFTGPVILSGTSSLVTANDISFANTINGTTSGVGDLTLNAGAAGDITFLDAIGATTRIGALTFTNADDINCLNITALSLLQVDGQGTSTFAGIDTSGAAGVIKSGNNFIRNGALTVSGGGSLEVTNSGTLTVISGDGTTVSGHYLQNGTGPVNILGVITTGDYISYSSPVTIAGAFTLNSGGDITFNDTLDGSFNITLSPGAGDVDFVGAVGGTSRVGALLVNSCTNFTSQDSLFATSINITETGGTVTYSNGLNTSGITGITISAEDISGTGSIIATNGGAVSITFSGTRTITGTSPFTVGSLTIESTGVGAITIEEDITATTGGIAFLGDVTLVENASLDTSGGLGDINFSGTVDSAPSTHRNLTLAAGTGDVIFDGVIGSSETPGTITISSARDVSAFADITAGAIIQTSGTGTTTFGGAVTTTSSSGISITTSDFIREGNITTTTGSGPLTVALSMVGTFTSTAPGTISTGGAFLQSGGSSASIGGSITTQNSNLTFAAPITLSGVTTMDTGAGAGNILLSSALDGGYNLTLKGGTGTITTSHMGATTRIGILTVDTGTSFSSQSITAGSVEISGITGLVNFGGTVNTNLASPRGILINSGSIFRGGDYIASNGGHLDLFFQTTSTGAVGQVIQVGSIRAETPGGAGIFFGGTVFIETGDIFLKSPVTLLTNATVTIVGDFITESVIDGNKNLTITFTGGGSADFQQNIGATTPLAAISLVNPNNVTIGGTLNAASLAQTGGTGTFQTLGAVSTSGSSGINISGGAITFDAGITTTGGGAVTLSHTGLLTIADSITFNLDGTFSENGTGTPTVSIGGDIITTNGPISFASSTTLTNDVTLDTGAGMGNITLQNTVDGPYCLTLDAGSGVVTMSAAVGALDPLNCLSATGATIFQNSTIEIITTLDYTGTVQLSNNVTTANSNVTVTGNVLIASDLTIDTGAGAGNVSVSGTINGTVINKNLTVSAGSGDIILNGVVGGVNRFNNLTLSGADITWAGLGSNGIGAIGTTDLTASNSITFSGTHYDNGVQSYTAGTSFLFTSGAPTSIGSNASAITFQTGTISLSAGNDLTVTSSGGNITFTDITVPDVNATNLIVNAGLGVVTYTNIGTVGNPLDVVDMTAQTFIGSLPNIHAASVSLSSPTIISIGTDQITSGVALVYNSPVIITTNNITFATCDGVGGGAPVTFNDTVDSDNPMNVRNITIDTCGSPVQFNGVVGAIAPLTSISVTNADGLDINSVMIVGSLTETSSVGTTTIASQLETTDAGGVNLAADDIVITGSIETMGGGGVTFTTVNGFTLQGGTIVSDGAFQQIGSSSSNSIAGTIETSAAPISIGGTTNLTGSTTLSTSGANITLSQAVTGSGRNLSLVAGTGDISVGGDIGTSIAPIGVFTITSTEDATLGNLYAGSVVQTNGTGTTTISGALVTSDIAGINLTGAAFNLTGGITTTNSGPVVINSSGTTVLSGGATIGGALTRSGLGSTTLSGTIVAGGDVSFSGAVTLSGTTSVNTSANQNNITFSSTIAGASEDLTLNLGNVGTLTFGQVVSNVGVFTITNAGTVAASSSISAESITQSAGGISSSFGSLTTTVGNLSLAAPVLSISGDIISQGNVVLTPASSVTLTLGPSTSILGTFTQSGGSAAFLQGNLTTANTAISFAAPVVLNGTATVSSGSGAGNITFSSTINGAQDLTLLAGTGNISFGGNMGSGTPLSSLAITSATNITYPSVTAGVISQAASSGTTTIPSTITSLAPGGISITGSTITQSGMLLSQGSGGISVVHSGVYTIGNTITSASSFSESGVDGSVELNGMILTQNGNITFANPITLLGNSSLSTNSGLGNINLATVMGAFDFGLAAGGGSIACGAMTGLGDLTVTSGNLTASGAISAETISQTSGSGTYGALSTTASGGITLQGTSYTLGGNVTTAAGGPLTIQNSGPTTLSGSTFSVSGAVSQSGSGTVTLSSAITSGGTVQFGAPILLSGTTGAITTSSDITFLGAIDGTSSGLGNITLNAGASGNVTFSSDIGASTRMGTLTITNANNITAANITAHSLEQVAGSGLSLFNDINTSGTPGVILAGNNFTQNGSLNVTGGGSFEVTNTGTLNISSGNTVSVAGHYQQSGSGSVNIKGTFFANQYIAFSSPFTLTGALVLNTSTLGGGNIAFSGANQPFDLTMIAGTGDITNTGNIGGTLGATRIGKLTVVSTHNLTLGTLVSPKNIYAASVSITSNPLSDGVVTLNGNVNTNTIDGVSFNGAFLVRGGNIIATNGGPLRSVFSETSTALTPGTINAGSVYVECTGGAGVFFGGSVVTTNGGIEVISPVTLRADAILDTSASGGDIHFYSTFNSGNLGIKPLTVTLGGGNIFFDGSVGDTLPLGVVTINSVSDVNVAGAFTAEGFVQNAGMGTTTFGGNLMINTSTGISIQTTNFERQGNITVTNGGGMTVQLGASGTFISSASGTISLDNSFLESGAANALLNGSILTTNDNIQFQSPITLAGNTTMNTGTGAGNISLSTINGTTANIQNLTLTAGSGNITINGDVGGSTRLGEIQVNSSTNSTFQGVQASSLNVTSSGAITMNGDINTNQSSGIQLIGNDITTSGGIMATNGGPLIEIFSGSLVNSSISPLRVGSLSVTSTMGGGVNFIGSVITDTAGITYNAPVNLTGQATFDTSLANGNIVFANTLESTQMGGPFNVFVVAGSGNVTFNEPIGGNGKPLLNLQINSANNVTGSDLSAAGLLQLAGTGTTSFAGSVSTTGSGGINMTGTSFSFTGGVTTSNQGEFRINQSGTLTLSSTLNLTGNLTQIGSGGNFLQGTINTNSNLMTFSGLCTLTNNLSLNSSGGNISCLQGMEGTHSITITADTGNVTISMPMSLSSPLVNFTVVSAGDIGLSGVGSQTSIMSGLLSLNCSGVLELDGPYYAAHQQYYFSSNDANLIYGTPMTFRSNGGNIEFASSVLQLNSDTDLVANTGGGNFSFIAIRGIDPPDLFVDAGITGVVFMGAFTPDGTMGVVNVTAGQIIFDGDLSFVTGTFSAYNTIENAGAQVDISATGDLIFDTQIGDVGSILNPILVHSGGQVFAGSGYLAAFDGTTGDSTINRYPPHPACVIYFNGVKIADCGPSPTPTPTPGTSTSETRIPGYLLATPGINSSSYNYASDYYFFPLFIDDTYFRKTPFPNIYYTPQPAPAPVAAPAE